MKYKKCQQCNEEFGYTRSTKKFCGVMCKNTYWNGKTTRVTAKLTEPQTELVEKLVSEFKRENKSSNTVS